MSTANATFDFSGFDEIKPEMQERITYALGEKYTNLRNWLEDYRQTAPQPFDFFLRRLFGEVLSQPDYGFHRNMDAVRVASSLIESIKKFRQVMEPINTRPDRFQQGVLTGNERSGNLSGLELGKEYIAMLEDGVIAAQYLESWRSENNETVLVAPAHTFLMMNRPVAVQFWLDPGSSGWAQRLSQPLTHPYVLSRHWEAGRVWTDADEVNAETESLARLTGGLLSRCREKVILALADLGETGFEQRGSLLRAFQKVSAKIPVEMKKFRTPTQEEAGALIAVIATIFGGWVRLFAPWVAGFPLNDGGLFHAMILSLQENQYRLPQYVEYNGLSIPFAYPPLGFYSGAFLSQISGASPVEILRWLPAIISMATIPAFYWLAKSILGSSFKAGIAAFIYAFIPRAMSWALMGGGLTRSFGLLFLLLTLASVHALFKKPNKKIPVCLNPFQRVDRA